MRVKIRHSARPVVKALILFSTIALLVVGLIAAVMKAPTVAAETAWTGAAWSNVSAGFTHSCGVSAGVGYCWRDNARGQLGDNTIIPNNYPTPINTTGVLSGKTILSIKASKNLQSSCAIASDQKLYCWGRNNQGQLGNGTTTDSLVPVAVTASGALAGKNIVDVDIGSSYVCAVASDSSLYCWGQNVLTPVAISMSGALSGLTVSSLSVGNSSACVVGSDARAYCWGDDGAGQLGNGAGGQSAAPVAVDTTGVMSGKTITKVVAGFAYACAIDNAGAMYCWGSNNKGQLGTGSVTSNQISPVSFWLTGALTGKTIQLASAGLGTTCVIASDSRAYCVGRNDSGELGNTLTSDSLVPTAVSTAGELGNIAVITISTSFGTNSCVRASDNQAYCWGGARTENDEVLITSPFKVMAKPIPHIDSVSFGTASGHNTLNLVGSGFPSFGYDNLRIFDGAFMSLNDSVVPMCNYFSALGVDSATSVGLFASQGVTVDPSWVSDTPSCYQLGDVDLDTIALVYTMTPTHLTVSLNDSFDVTASGKISLAGSNELTFNNGNSSGGSSSGGSSGSSGSTTTTQTTVTTTTTQTTTNLVASEEISIAINDVDIEGDPTISPTATFSGTAPAGSTVTVTVHSDPVSCSDVADETNRWSCTLPSALPAGDHTADIAVVTPDGVTHTFGPYAVTVRGDLSTSTDTDTPEQVDVATPAMDWAPWILSAAGLLVLIGIIIAIVKRRSVSRVL